jgi:hypothetical protein
MALTEPSGKDAPGHVGYTQSASKTRRYEGCGYRTISGLDEPQTTQSQGALA